MSNILVTGAAGFIGSALSKKLLSKGHTVIGIDNFFRGKKENLPINENFKFYEYDLREGTSFINNVIKQNKVEKIFHYAAINGTKYFYDFPYKVFQDNVKITENVLFATKDTNVKKIIYSSSSEVYGFYPETPTSERHDIILDVEAERDSYACSKVHNDFLVKLYCESNSIDYLMLRIFNVYGPNMDSTEYGQVVPEFFRKIKEKEFAIIGDGLQTRSFCFINDHVNLTLLVDDSCENTVLNLGNDEEVTINYLAQMVHRISNKEFNPTYLDPRPNDTLVRKPCLKKMRSYIGDYQYTSLFDGLKECQRK